jgi:hypothetical protein
MPTRLVIRRDQITLVMAGRDGPVVADLMRRGRRVQNRAKQLAPVNHGRLRSDIQIQLVYPGAVPAVRVGNSVDYAYWVHEGTGIYGPRRRWIVPKRAKVLRFRPGRGGYIYRPRVRGAKGRPYLRDALPAARY